ncbi:MAG: hypothetical protein ACPG5B_11760 [Chitinophagales bacterium]
MNIHLKILLFIVVAFSSTLFNSSNTLQAQGFYTTFGQNRVQYHDFIWSYYESDNFITYYYQGGYDLCKFTVVLAETTLADIESKLEYKNNTKVEIMVYHNLSDLKQTNIGLNIERNNTGGVTKIIGNKIFVHFDGNHQNLARQIREGIVRVSLEKMIFGSNIQEILQNAVLLNLPDWFVNGLVSYVGEEWSPEMDDRLRAGILRGDYTDFNKLEGEEATFAGHALWHYIAQINGQTAIPNILYLTRINRSIESGFLFVLGNTQKNVINDFNNYYSNLYRQEITQCDSISNESLIYKSGKNFRKKNILLDEMKVSPTGKYIAYTTSEIGKNKVFVLNTETNERRVILRTGFKSHTLAFTDNYPLLAWDKSGEKLAVVYEKRDKIKLMIYDVEKNVKINDDVTKFQQVVDISFMSDPRKLVMSAVQRGQVDLWIYFIPNTKTTRLTNDFYTELQPRYIEMDEHEGILFASNRPTDTLRTERLDTILPPTKNDIFFYDLKNTGLDENKDRNLVRVTNTPYANEYFPSLYDSTHIAFLSTENGVNNRYAAHFDSVFVRQDIRVYYPDSFALNPTYPLENLKQEGLIDTIIYQDIYKKTATSYPITNYAESILEADVATKSGEDIRLFYRNSRYEFHKEKVFENVELAKKSLKKTSYRKQYELFEKTEKKRAAERDVNVLSPDLIQKGVLKVYSPKEKETAKEENATFLIDDFLEENNKGIETEKTDSQTVINNDSLQDEMVKETAIDSLKSKKVDIENYFFQSEFDFLEEDAIVDENTINANNKDANASDADKQRPIFVRTDIRKHFTQFSIDHVVSQVDNTVIFNSYESFNLTPVEFSVPDLNAFFKFGVTDLMENYRIMGGFRFPLGLNGMEYFLEYHNLKKRLDKKILLYRKSARNQLIITDIPDFPEFPVTAKNITNYAQYTLSYPFDVNTSLRGHVGLRNDRIEFLATDRVSIELPPAYENWAHAKLEYIYDNTIKTGLNLLNGMRYKLYAEVHKPFDAVVTDQKLDFSIKNTGLLGIVGGDFRHYQKVHKQIIFANRFAFAHSFGSKKMIYYLGGVENWLAFNPEKYFDYSTPVDENGNYAFKSLATNVRGFKQNVRNGNSFAVINSELRIPIFSYLSLTPIRSEFLKNFQIVGFADIGMAWEGISPFNDENQFTVVTIGGPPSPVEATVKYFRSPIVGGYGLGVRSKILGYFLRFDAAWGVDTGARSDAVLYWSLGLDF